MAVAISGLPGRSPMEAMDEDAACLHGRCDRCRARDRRALLGPGPGAHWSLIRRFFGFQQQSRDGADGDSSPIGTGCHPSPSHDDRDGAVEISFPASRYPYRAPQDGARDGIFGRSAEPARTRPLAGGRRHAAGPAARTANAVRQWPGSASPSTAPLASPSILNSGR
jgi:hypothetical protein